MRVLLVGSGGREHALAWKLSQSPLLEELHAAPGNPGIAGLAPCHPVRPEDPEAVLGLARSLDADLVVVGPEAPLVAGVADEVRRAGVAVFGPGREAARIEGSKTFAKDVMRAAGVPTAEDLAMAKPPCVVKLDGLAGGKGVFVCRDQGELDAALRFTASTGGPVLIEELLEGEEVSVFAICDGTSAVALPPVQDFKRAADGNEGPNTGGMGAYSPVPLLADEDADSILELVHRPVLAELARRDAPFVGLLYAGLMITADGPRVLEFNCRFGDPETQSVLPRLDGDLLAALAAAAAGHVEEGALVAADRAAVTVVVTAGDYPERGDTGTPIVGLEDAGREGALVFHAGTALRDGSVVTNGGRLLAVTGLGETVGQAREAAYEAVGRISIPGARYRSDIALAAVTRA